MSSKHEDHYSFEKTYSYDEESPYNGAIADGYEDAEVISGEASFCADITWDESSEQYEVDWNWSDLSEQFDDVNGEAPSTAYSEFYSDVLSFLEAKGIDTEDDVAF